MIGSTNDQLQNVIKSVKNAIQLKIFILKIEHVGYISFMKCFPKLIL